MPWNNEFSTQPSDVFASRTYTKVHGGGVAILGRAPEVLVVEDNPGDVRLLKEAFSELGVAPNLRVAADGAEALGMLFDPNRTWTPDLIFLDLNLPKVDGHEVLAKLKGDNRTHHIPLIVLTSSRAETDIQRAYDAHANAYVRKPTTLEDLITYIRSVKSFWMETARLPGPAPLVKPARR